MGETFFAELASKRYPPEVRQELNEIALHQSHVVVIKKGVSAGTYALGEEWQPKLGTDLMVRAGHAFGTGAGISPDLVELVPRPNLSELVKLLQPEFQALIGQMGHR